MKQIRVAVVGHVEWGDFLRVDHLPSAGDIVHAEESWEEPAGGGTDAAVQLAKLAGGGLFFTALGDDRIGHRALQELEEMGLRVHTRFRPEPSRRAITHIDSAGERTITIVGNRLAPRASDPLPWHELAETDAVFITAGDADAVRLARRAEVVVATARIVPLLREAGIELDAIVGSQNDPAEAYAEGDLDLAPRLVVRTAGEDGGTFTVRGEAPTAFQAAPPPGPEVDRYGAGDSFAGGLTYGLGAGLAPADAVHLAARCGAAVVTGRGPFATQLRAVDLED
ncbi:MAG TPA: PfkB family carbohydrate kinase [Actinomycetota bacterium]|nr:PfkB family carbohydrate kinase [Actinomycetota bacterium]